MGNVLPFPGIHPSGLVGFLDRLPRILAEEIGKNLYTLPGTKTSNPAKNGVNRVKTELTMLIFRTGVASSPRTDDQISFFGFCGTLAVLGVAALQLTIGDYTGTQWLNPYTYLAY